ncbi:MAG: DUF1707 domain-containing protein [Solirubrobacterales bacterium]|nr:DUF1707 domain-containing protein [Solirubrobacterales bacterium]
MADRSDLRASDEQRDRAAQEIREHFAAGRLTDDELSDRVQAVYAARTEGELNTLLSDLPKLPASVAQQKAALVQRRRELQRRLLQQTGGGAALFVLCTVIWLSSGAHGQFWPVWVALVVILPLLRNGWRLYGPAPELDRVERELESRQRRDQIRNDARGDAYGRARRDARQATREGARRARRHGRHL